MPRNLITVDAHYPGYLSWPAFAEVLRDVAVGHDLSEGDLGDHVENSFNERWTIGEVERQATGDHQRTLRLMQ